jgi:glycosyltransferase involved in cell wall biosynthesis
MGECSISFIIPAYNAVATIWRCLDSIYSLPLVEDEFEVIVIDDCSTDNTIVMVEKYASRHSNFVLFRQLENHRQGAARNKGIAMAKGKFVVFVDSDDEVGDGLFKAAKMAVDRDLDMVVMRVAIVSGEGMFEREMSLPYQKERIFSGVELQTELPFWFTGPVAYVYRNSFLKKVSYRFAEDVLFEDSDFVNVHLFHARRISYCDSCGYVVHYNAASTTHTISYKHLCDYALLGTRMLRFFESLEDKTSKYSEGIREGGSYNIMMAFRRLPRLKSSSEIRAFYDRFDARYDRKMLFGYREPAYCWTHWTRFCLKHRKLATMIIGVAIPLVKKRVRD